MATWRINLKTKETSDEELKMIKKYCFEKGYIAMGWRIDELENPTLEEYISAVDKRKWRGGYKRAAEYIKKEMTTGSYCFARDNTNYYVGKITSDCYYASEDKHREYFFSWYRKIDWKKIGKQDETPGIIVGFLSHQKQATINKLYDRDLHEMVKFVYKKLSGNKIEKTENKLTKDNFTSLLYFETLEDLVGLYLQEKYNYLMIPKSGKINTPEFEYILIDRSTKQKIFVQVKNKADIDLDIFGEEYKNDLVYVFSDLGYTGLDKDYIIKIDKNELYLYFEKIKKYLGQSFQYELEFYGYTK